MASLVWSEGVPPLAGSLTRGLLPRSILHNCRGCASLGMSGSSWNYSVLLPFAGVGDYALLLWLFVMCCISWGGVVAPVRVCLLSVTLCWLQIYKIVVCGLDCLPVAQFLGTFLLCYRLQPWTFSAGFSSSTQVHLPSAGLLWTLFA